MQEVFRHSIPHHTTNTLLFCGIPQQASATCNNQTLHSSSTGRANDPRPGGLIQGHSAAVLAPRGVQRQSKTTTILPINPKLLQQLIESILSNRHLSKYDHVAYFGCLRAREVSYPSTHSFHSKQHLTIRDIIIHQNTVQLELKKQQNRSIQERGHHYHYRTKQTKHLSSADHKSS